LAECLLDAAICVPTTVVISNASKPLLNLTNIDKIDIFPSKEVDIKEAFPTLKPRNKKSVSYDEEIVSVTFIPKQTKPKEIIEQEFSIKAQTYEEEEISMTGNVKLHRKSVIEEPIQTLTINETKETEFQQDDLKKN